MSSTLLPGFIAVIDEETTGWYSDKPDRDWARVVELGAVLLAPDGQEVAAFGSLVKPDILDERADRALEFNGITREMLAFAPLARKVTWAFSEWLQVVDSPLTVTSFNVAFDSKFYERMPGAALSLGWTDCIMLATKTAMVEADSPLRYEPDDETGKRGRRRARIPLATACEWLGVPQPETAHRALDDARAAAGVLVALARRKRLGDVLLDAERFDVELAYVRADEKAHAEDGESDEADTFDLDDIDPVGV